MTPPLTPPHLKEQNGEGEIIIYVDGVQVLAPADCIYIPPFEKENVARQVEGGNQSKRQGGVYHGIEMVL
jgi:hypothetical protein